MLTCEFVGSFIKRVYIAATIRYKDSPSADNWNKLLVIMLVLQQWHQHGADPGLLAKLENETVSGWFECIVKHCCDGRSIAEVLEERP